MLLYSKNDPNLSIFKNGNRYRFINGFLELPASVALQVATGKSDIEILKEGDETEFSAESWTKNKKLNLETSFSFSNGYGKSALFFTKGLLEQGVDLSVQVLNGATSLKDILYEDVFKIVHSKEGLDPSAWKLFYDVPSRFEKKTSNERTIFFTMFEASRIPKSWVDSLNRAERIIVPCSQNKQAFIDSGVKKDIFILPLGTDPAFFPERNYKEYEKNEKFIFGIMGNLTYRKGTDILIKAFKLAFPKEKDVVLYVKTTRQGNSPLVFYPFMKEIKDDPRIVLNENTLDHKQVVADFFHQIDAFVFPTRGEGYGLPPIEAMMTGAVAIATNWSGPADYMKPEFSYPLDYKIVPVPNNEPVFPGLKVTKGYPKELQADEQEWAEPDLDFLVDTLRHIYKNQTEAKEKGRKSANYARRWFNHKEMAKKLISYLNEKV